MSRRALRTQRKDVTSMKRTGWEPGLMQDDSREFSKWLASQPDARLRVRERCEEIAADSPLPLSDGTQADPSTPWQLPQQPKE